jgi:hypothetical protein
MNIKKIAFVLALTALIYKIQTSGENQEKSQKAIRALSSSASISYLLHEVMT